MKETKKEFKRWRAKKREKYFYLNSWGAENATFETNTKIDDHLYNTGNYFQTVEELEAKKQFDISWQKIKDSAEGFVPRLLSDLEDKYFCIFDFEVGEYKICDTSTEYQEGVVYFKSEEQLKKSLKELQKDWDMLKNSWVEKKLKMENWPKE